jgi:hypothetical protein
MDVLNYTIYMYIFGVTRRVLNTALNVTNETTG